MDALHEPNAECPDRALRELTELDEAPQRDQQLARQRHDPDLPHPLAAAAEARPVPLRQRTLGLEAKPGPRLLDRPPDPAAAILADPLLPLLRSAVVGSGRQSGKRSYLSAVLEASPA